MGLGSTYDSSVLDIAHGQSFSLPPPGPCGPPCRAYPAPSSSSELCQPSAQSRGSPDPPVAAAQMLCQPRIQLRIPHGIRSHSWCDHSIDTGNAAPPRSPRLPQARVNGQTISGNRVKPPPSTSDASPCPRAIRHWYDTLTPRASGVKMDRISLSMWGRGCFPR